MREKFKDVIKSWQKFCGLLAIALIFLIPASRSVIGKFAKSMNDQNKKIEAENYNWGWNDEESKAVEENAEDPETAEEEMNFYSQPTVSEPSTGGDVSPINDTVTTTGSTGNSLWDTRPERK